MTVIFCIVAVIAAISIYDYFTTRSWQQVTSDTRNDAVFERRNQAYGAYQIRRDYNKILVIILCGLTAGAGALYAATRGKKATYIAKGPKETTIIIPLNEKKDDEKPKDIFDTRTEQPESVEETAEFREVVPVDNPVPDPVPVPEPGQQVGLDPHPGGGDPFGEPGDPQPPGPPGGNPTGTPPPPPPTPYVDEPAEYPGGREALLKFLGDNLKYPDIAVQLGLEGKCQLKFVVSKTGNISDVEVMRGVPDCPECDREAVRVVKKMPDWHPGKVKGKPVDSYFNLPVKFAFAKN